jgi:methionyl aminopeptidase
MNIEEINGFIKVGKIAQEMRKFVRGYIKPGMPIVEIAKTIQEEIEKRGAVCAFPVNLSIDDLAAHYHPAPNEKTLASGLLKVDMGVSIDGYIADTALTLDLTEDNRHKELINASDEALKSAIELLSSNPTINEIGETIQNTITKKGFSPIVNLSGHSISRYNVHAGITIPNYANGNKNKLDLGVYAIEPFATTGEGRIYEGESGNIYSIINQKNPRSPKAREIYKFVMEKYKTLPFSSREIQEKFGPISKLALTELENQDIIKSYGKLIEKAKGPVTQSEHTVIITEENGKRKIIVTTREE